MHCYHYDLHYLTPRPGNNFSVFLDTGWLENAFFGVKSRCEARQAEQLTIKHVMLLQILALREEKDP